MGRKVWHHEVDPNWLEARRHVLTATDIVNLLPEFKRWIKAGDPDALPPGFSSLWCKKITQGFDEIDSYNAAARGHIMEPYAIEDWNNQCNPIFCHWDDALIVRDGVGFSPDAMTIPQDNPSICFEVSDSGRSLIPGGNINELCPTPWAIMEVKCYEPANHMKSLCIKNKMDHKEIWQIATAFHVLPDLERAYLLWYCPNAPFPMHSEEFSREELEDAIDTVAAIAGLYGKVADHWAEQLDDVGIMYASHTEDEIYNEWLKTLSDNIFELR